MKCSAVTRHCPEGSVGVAIFIALVIGALIDFLARLP